MDHFTETYVEELEATLVVERAYLWKRYASPEEGAAKTPDHSSDDDTSGQ